MRTCVACREEGGKRSLLRLVVAESGLITTDPTGRARGRGAYLHLTPECVDQARRRRSLERSLKAAVPPDLWTSLPPFAPSDESNPAIRG